MNQHVVFGVLVATLLCSWTSYKNSLEAHRHMHELACVLNHEPLCWYHLNPKK